MALDGWVFDMSEMRPDMSRRRLLRVGGIGAAIAIAGCGGSDNGDDGTDSVENGEENNVNGTDDGDNGGNGAGEEGEHLPDDPDSAFELAGDGAEQYRRWLVPEYTIDADLDADTKQLYQFNDFELAAEQGQDSLLELRDHYAASLGADPEAMTSEILVGPVEGGAAHRIFFGSFDRSAVTEFVEAEGFEQTGEDGEFTIFEERIAVSEEVIIEHPSYEKFLEASRGERDTIGDVDEDVQLLLDLVPTGPLVTLSRREGYTDLSVDAMTVLEYDAEELPSRAVRTIVFTEESDLTEDRIRELVVDNSSFDEILTMESYGRVAMVEVKR